MRILHYFLGFHRAGGLNRYAADLALTQVEQGDEVFALCPAGGLFSRRKPIIRQCGKDNGIVRFELRGGASVPALSGVRDPERLRSAPRLAPDLLLRFADEVRPDILHIHTWMGFPVELLDLLKQRGVRIVFTTHDYFGICPRVNLIDEQGNPCSGRGNIPCSRCNRNAPGEWFLALSGWNALLRLKKILSPAANLVRHILIKHRHSVPEENISVRDYEALSDCYEVMLRKCDAIHFNSQISRQVYQRYYPGLTGAVIPITHRGISDHRTNPSTPSGKLRLSFVGSAEPYKGLPLLLRVLNRLQQEGQSDWTLDIWGGEKTAISATKNIQIRGRFSPSHQAEVFTTTDLVIMPSICNETFGFVVLEALSYGIPVLCSDMVGAQLQLSPGMIFHGEEGLYHSLQRIMDCPETLAEERRKICSGSFLYDLQEHARAIRRLYQNGVN